MQNVSEKVLNGAQNWPGDTKTKATTKIEKDERIIKEVMAITARTSGIMNEISIKMHLLEILGNHMYTKIPL